MAALTASRISLSLVSATGYRNASWRTMIRRSRLLSGVCLVGAGVGCCLGFRAWAFLVAGGAAVFGLAAGVAVEVLAAATFAQDFGALPRTVESLASIRLLVLAVVPSCSAIWEIFAVSLAFYVVCIATCCCKCLIHASCGSKEKSP